MCRRQNSGIQMLARHGQKSVAISPIHLLKGHANPVPPCLISGSLVGAAHHVFISADCVQHAKAILPDENAGAECSQFCVLLVHANSPTTPMQCECSSEPSKACASNLRMHELCAPPYPAAISDDG